MIMNSSLQKKIKYSMYKKNSTLLPIYFLEGLDFKGIFSHIEYLLNFSFANRF